ncbi:MAG: hypothetical protein JWN70_4330 [Planctomycetaceae bacterium]|nr:hypothetical protein [Planctomycetaceae bacterium]
MRRPMLALICLLGGCWFAAQVWLVLPTGTVSAQEKAKSKTSKKKGSTSVLDVKANEIQDGFMKSAEELASEYYDLKEYDKARTLLKSIQALDPNRPNLDAKLKKLDDDLIGSNEIEMEVTTSRGWDTTAVMVGAGKPIRIKAAGNYKFVVSSQLSPNGFTAKSATPTPQDLVHDLPVGALIGIVIPTSVQQDDKKKDKPFLIGEGCDYTSQKDGVLFIRVNAPPENKNTGKIEVTISGGVKVGK